MKHIIATAALLATCAVASAADYSFDFRSQTPTSFSVCTTSDRCGANLTFASGSLTATATASYKSTPQSTPTDQTVVQDYKSGKSYVGLGVYHTPSPFISSDDNITVGETLTLTFDHLVTLKSLVFSADGHGPITDTNATYLLNGSSQTFLSSLSNQTPSTVFSFAYGGDNFKQFYLSGMTVSAVPEPESYALMLAGLGLMGAIARRRNKAATA